MSKQATIFDDMATDDEDPMALYDAVRDFRNAHPELEPPKKQIIHGNPPNKSNSYRIIKLKSKTGKEHYSLAPTPILKEYQRTFILQCQLYRNKMMTGRLTIDIKVFYSSARPDADGCLKVILDCLQAPKGKRDGVSAYKNDRQIKRIILESDVDAVNPRIEFYLSQYR